MGGEGGFPPPAPSAATAAGGARSSPKLPIFFLLVTWTKPVSRAFSQLWFHAVGQRGPWQLCRACLSAALSAQGRACGCPHLVLTPQPHVLGAWMDPTIVPSAQSRDSACVRVCGCKGLWAWGRGVGWVGATQASRAPWAGGAVPGVRTSWRLPGPGRFSRSPVLPSPFLTRCWTAVGGA